MMIRHGLVSARRPALTIQFYGQEQNFATEQSLLCGRPKCMEQSTSSSSWSWQLVFVWDQAQNLSVYILYIL